MPFPKTTLFAVRVVAPVPPLATGRVPVTPVVKGSPVALVNVPDEGVPRAGVTKVGLVPNTAAPEPVSLVNAVASCAEVNEPNTAALPVEVMWPVRFALVVTVPAVKLAAVPDKLVATPDAGVPNAGVTRVGDVPNTNAPDPVSLVTADARLDDVGVPRKVATLLASPDTPVEIGNPVAFVNVPPDGVPSAAPNTTGAPAEPTLTARAVNTPVPAPEILPTATDPAEPDAFPVNAPTNVVVARELVFELKVSPVLDFGPRSPVAAVKNAGKQVVSVASLATVMSVGVPEAATTAVPSCLNTDTRITLAKSFTA